MELRKEVVLQTFWSSLKELTRAHVRELQFVMVGRISGSHLVAFCMRGVSPCMDN